MIPESRPVVEGTKSQADIKTRIGGYKLSTPLETYIRPMGNTNSFNQVGDYRGKVTVRDTKTLNVETTPKVNMGFRGAGKIYTTRPVDSRDNCKVTDSSHRESRSNVTEVQPLDLHLSNEERRAMALKA